MVEGKKCQVCYKFPEKLMNKQSKKVSVPQKEEELKCRGTFLINTNYMLYKKGDDLDVCTPK